MGEVDTILSVIGFKRAKVYDRTTSRIIRKLPIKIDNIDPYCDLDGNVAVDIAGNPLYTVIVMGGRVFYESCYYLDNCDPMVKNALINDLLEITFNDPSVSERFKNKIKKNLSKFIRVSASKYGGDVLLKYSKLKITLKPGRNEHVDELIDRTVSELKKKKRIVSMAKRIYDLGKDIAYEQSFMVGRSIAMKLLDMGFTLMANDDKSKVFITGRYSGVDTLVSEEGVFRVVEPDKFYVEVEGVITENGAELTVTDAFHPNIVKGDTIKLGLNELTRGFRTANDTDVKNPEALEEMKKQSEMISDGEELSF